MGTGKGWDVDPELARSNQRTVSERECWGILKTLGWPVIIRGLQEEGWEWGRGLTTLALEC